MFFKIIKKRKYFRLFICIFLVIITVFVFAFSSYASIMPALDARYSYSSAFTSEFDLDIWMQGANGYADRTYTYNSLTRDNVNLIGTNDVVNVSRPNQYIGMTTFATDNISVSYELPYSMFVNEYNDGIDGIYRYRIGIYIRAFGDVSGAGNFSVKLGYLIRDDNGNLVENGANDGVYIPTGANVPGRYYLMSHDFFYHDGYTVSFEITIQPGTGDNRFRFSGGTPYYEKSFLAFTSSYIDLLPVGDDYYYPDKLGSVVRYGDRFILLDSSQPVKDTYVNPFDSSEVVVAGQSTRLFTSESYPGTVYVYYPSVINNIGDQYGVLYKGYSVESESLGNLGAYFIGDDYTKGYWVGYQYGREYYQSEVDMWKRLYNEVLSGKLDTTQKGWYDIGYADGVQDISASINTTYNTIDRLGNLIRKCVDPILSISVFGIGVRVVIVLGVVVCFTLFIIKKVR